MEGDNTLSLVGRGSREGDAASAYLILLFECDRPMAPSLRVALQSSQRVLLGRDSARSCVRFAEAGQQRVALRVNDRWMSSSHAQLLHGPSGWLIEDAGSKNGVLVNGRRVTTAPLHDGDLIELGHTFLLFRVGAVEPAGFKVDADELAPPAPGLGTLSPELARRFEPLPDIARSLVSVLVTGESGTGKELIARAVHALSGRSGAFVAVNCGALPENLVETELFGYRKGAFSGASEDRVGLVRAADRGTLFLDEIGDLPMSSQAAFLRVLQEREVLPVGATRPIPVDIRLVAATHRDLPARIETGDFRGDLLARISGAEVALPPLRERRDDLGLLVRILLRRLAPDRTDAIAFSPEAVRALAQYSWPYNVRELEKALGAALAVSRGRVELDHLPDEVRKPPAEPREKPAKPLSEEDQLRRAELSRLLAEHGGNVSAVARAMGKARMQIQRWMKRYGLRGN